MKTTFKNHRIKTFSLLAAAGVAGFLFAGVKTLNAGADGAGEPEIPQAYTIEDVTNAETGSLKMATGASIKNVGSSEEKNGLRYALTLSQEHYKGLMQSAKNGVYDNIAFGVLLLPKAYNDTFAAREYAFGENVKYDWAVKDENGEWQYDDTAADGKARIFNLDGDAMRYNEELQKMAFYGTITNVKLDNLGREMVGVGYIAYTQGEKVSYVFTPAEDEKNNVRTMAHVAQKAIDAGAENSEWLKATYIAPVIEKGISYTYNVEYYFGDENGEYKAAPSRTVEYSAKLGDNVTAAELDLGRLKGYVSDEEKSASECTGNLKYALGGELTLKRYYKRVTQLFETNATPELNLLSLTDEDLSEKNVTATLTAANGRKVEIANAKNVVTAEIPQGLYTLELKAEGKTAYIGSLDFYNEDDGMVWQDLSEYSVNDSEILRGGYLRLADTEYGAIDGEKVLSFKMVAGENSTTEVGMRVRAIHSKAYYEMMSETYSAVKFSVYLSVGGMNIKLKGTEGKPSSDGNYYGVWQDNAKWAEYSIDLSYLLEKWEAMNGVGKLNLGTTLESQLFTTYFGHDGKETVSIGRFGCTAKDALVQVNEVQLVETAATPKYNLLSLDTENKLNSNMQYTALLTAPNGRRIRVENAAEIDTANIPQGVYAAEVKIGSKIYLTATLDIYTAADGMVWQNIDEYSVNDARVWKFASKYLGKASFATIDNVNVLQFITVKAGASQASGCGIRLRALHSKEYYEMMSGKYSAITFRVRGTTSLTYYYQKLLEDENETSKWVKANVWGDKDSTDGHFVVDIAYILAHWDERNELVKAGTSTALSNLFYANDGVDGETVVSVGGFGCVERTAE